MATHPKGPKIPGHPITKEEKARIARENGKKGGRPVGSINALPMGAVQAIKTMKFRVKREYQDNEAVTEIAGNAFERIVDVMHGKVFSRKAPSILKAAQHLREETCEPLVKETKLSGQIGLAQAVVQAANKINSDKKE